VGEVGEPFEKPVARLYRRRLEDQGFEVLAVVGGISSRNLRA